jgi:hypothetical protein
MSKLLDSAVVAVALGVLLTVVLSLLLRMTH